MRGPAIFVLVLVAVSDLVSAFLTVRPLLTPGVSHQQPATATRTQPQMIFGFGGGAKKSASQGITINVQQKFYKDTTIQVEKPGNLRKELLAAGVDVYPLQGKIYNCGGGGSCGTCAVEVLSGAENLSAKGPPEKKILGSKPDSYRLSCCTRVQGGEVTIRTKP